MGPHRAAEFYFAECGFTPDHVQALIFQPPASVCRTNVISPSSVIALPRSLYEYLVGTIT
jgi:hypothetical protein